MYTGSVCAGWRDSGQTDAGITETHWCNVLASKVYLRPKSPDRDFIITGGGGPGVVETPDLADRQQVPVTWTW